MHGKSIASAMGLIVRGKSIASAMGSDFRMLKGITWEGGYRKESDHFRLVDASGQSSSLVGKEGKTPSIGTPASCSLFLRYGPSPLCSLTNLH